MIVLSLALVAVAAVLVGCPRKDEPGTAKVTVLLGTGTKSLAVSLMEAVAPKTVVAPEDIESLIVTVTSVELDPADDDGEDEDVKHHTGGGPSNGVFIFTGSVDVDLVNPEGLSEILSTAEIPAGTYTKVRIGIENPRLRLAADPDTEITNIKLTANGHVFISQTLEIPEGESLIVLTFTNIHLVLNGNGRYVLTPQLSVDISITSADVTATGTIASVDPDNDSMVVALTDGDITVLYGSAAIFLPGDTDTPNGTEADLVVGASVEVIGTVDLDGVVTATEIHLLT
jgi:hypothetical protein